MAETFRFFDAINYTEAQFAEVLERMVRPQGVILELGGSFLAPSAPGGMVVNIGDGEAMVKGFWYQNTTPIGVVMGSNSSGSTRVDVICLRLDRSANTLQIATHVGTAGAGAPALTQVPGGTWEFPLCNVSVLNGAVNIASNNVVDRRTFSQWNVSALDPTMAVKADVTNEATARATADTTLQTNITNEANTRIANDNTIVNSLNTEISARSTGDTNEATARNNQDITLQQNINGVTNSLGQEANARIAGDCRARGYVIPGSGLSTQLFHQVNIATTRQGTGLIQCVFTTLAPPDANYIVVASSANSNQATSCFNKTTADFYLSTGTLDIPINFVVFW